MKKFSKKKKTLMKCNIQMRRRRHWYPFPLDEDEVVQPCFPPAHEDGEVISPNDANYFVKDLSDMDDLHIDDFI
jgi:hypothetical protein